MADNEDPKGPGLWGSFANLFSDAASQLGEAVKNVKKSVTGDPEPTDSGPGTGASPTGGSKRRRRLLKKSAKKSVKKKKNKRKGKSKKKSRRM